MEYEKEPTEEAGVESTPALVDEIAALGGPASFAQVDLGALPEIQQLIELRAVLEPQSIVDSSGVFFADHARVDRFLRLSGFDTDNTLDLQRLGELHHEAITYLAETHGYRIPEQVQYPERIHDVFLVASQGAGRARLMACMALKVMHILHHVDVRQFAYNTVLSEAQIFTRTNSRVFDVIDAMRASGIRVSEFTAGQKSRESITTKLLAKKEALATQLFDRLRFRVVVEEHSDLVPAILYLLRNLFPFNYIVPGQSQNGLIRAEDLAVALNLSVDTVNQFFQPRNADIQNEELPATPPNEFSGKNFHCVNFVARIPLRIDDMVSDGGPAVVFAETEIQLVDQKTHHTNNEGDSAHGIYKERQSRKVRQRLQGSNHQVLSELRSGKEGD